MGGHEYARALLAGSCDAGPGQLLYGFEASHENGPWDVAENYRKYNGVLRYTVPIGDGLWGMTAMAYNGIWSSTNQVPRRAVDAGLIDRFGSLDPSDGGTSHRYSLSSDYEASVGGGRLRVYRLRHFLLPQSVFRFHLLPRTTRSTATRRSAR